MVTFCSVICLMDWVEAWC